MEAPTEVHGERIQWVRIDGNGFVHGSLSNLPLEEWHDGVTFCHRKGRVLRMPRVPVWARRQGKVCADCLSYIRDTEVRGE